MTILATFPTPEDAHLFRSYLESRGIEAVLLDEYFVQLFWQYSNAVGGVKVAVDEQDISASKEAYQTYMAALRDGPYPIVPVRAWPAVAVASLLIGIPMILFGRSVSRRNE